MRYFILLQAICQLHFLQAQTGGIATDALQERLEPKSGNILLSNSSDGLILNAADRPMITIAALKQGRRTNSHVGIHSCYVDEYLLWHLIMALMLWLQ